MKKLIALLLAVIMVLSMAACGSDNNEGTATPDTPQSTDPTGSDSQTDPTTGTTGATEPTEPFVPKLGEGVYSRISYTAKDEELSNHRNDVVATIGEEKLTVSELQAYYWFYVFDFLNNYSYYLSMFGLDLSQPLDQQQCPESDGTWQQYFLSEALNSWHANQSLELKGRAAKIKIPEDIEKTLNNLKSDLEKSAQEGKFASIDEMLQKDLGVGIDFEGYKAYMEDYYGGYAYYLHSYDNLKVTDAQVEDYFNKNEEALYEAGITKESGKVVDVRHILLTPEGGTTDADGNTTYTDAQWDACKTKAQGILDTWLSGKKTEESFAELANQHSTDPGSNTNGGLYEGVHSGDMVLEFDKWCFDSSRKVGDYGLVKTSYGYHIMFYSADEEQWIYECRNAVMDNEISEIMAQACKDHPMTVDYDKIMLGYVNLTSE